MGGLGTTRVASILSLLLGMATVAAIWFGGSQLDSGDTPGAHQARLKIVRELAPTDTSPLDDEPCLFDTSPWNQVVITEASGEIVASFWPESGLIETDPNGVAHCIVYAEFQLPASEYYTLHVNEQYSWVVTSREMYAGELPVDWFDAKPVDFSPTTAPSATPEPVP